MELVYRGLAPYEVRFFSRSQDAAVRFDPDEARLLPGETQSIIVTFAPPRGTPPGERVIELIVREWNVALGQNASTAPQSLAYTLQVVTSAEATDASHAHGAAHASHEAHDARDAAASAEPIPPIEEEPARPPPRLTLTPSEVELHPGERATIRVRVDDASMRAYSIGATTPAGIRAFGPEVALAPAEGSTMVELSFDVEAARDAPVNLVAEGLATLDDGSASAPYTVRVPAAPPVAPATVAAASPMRAAALAAAGVGGAAFAFVAARRRWPWLFAALYARLRPSAVLDHAGRRRMAEEVRAHPGLPASELQRRMGFANGEFAHHLRTLERARILIASRDGQLRRIYPVETGRVESVPQIDERVLHLIAARGSVTTRALRRELGVSRQALHYHLRKLTADGRIVTRVARGETRVESASR
jgi:DNA-binding transcriptional ArsR family regulator